MTDVNHRWARKAVPFPLLVGHSKIIIFYLICLNAILSVAFSATQPLIPAAVMSLDGEWLLAPDPKNEGREQQWWQGPRPDAKKTKVPWIVQDAFPSYHGVVWDWRDFTPPANPHHDGRYLLR